MGKFDWQDWIRGLAAGFVGGGSGSVSSAFSNLILDPKDYNMEHPSRVLINMGVVFLVSGLLSMFAYLHQNPVPVERSKATSA